MLHKILSLIDMKLLSFFLIGIIDTILSAVIMLSLYNLAGWSYWLASATNYVIVGIVCFVLNRHFTFHSQGKILREALRFAIIIIGCYLIAYGVAKPLVFRLLSHTSETVQTNVAMVTGMVFFGILNYLGQRLFTFQDKPEKN